MLRTGYADRTVTPPTAYFFPTFIGLQISYLFFYGTFPINKFLCFPQDLHRFSTWQIGRKSMFSTGFSTKMAFCPFFAKNERISSQVETKFWLTLAQLGTDLNQSRTKVGQNSFGYPYEMHPKSVSRTDEKHARKMRSANIGEKRPKDEFIRSHIRF